MELTSNEKSALELFAGDTELFSTIRKVVRRILDKETEKIVALTLMNFRLNLTNEEAGARLRACAEGIRLVETIFADLAQYKKQLPKELKVNPAR